MSPLPSARRPRRRFALRPDALETRQLLSITLAHDFSSGGSMGAETGYQGPSGIPGESVVVGDVLYFAADDGVHGRELWKSDGTAQGTVLVKDIVPGASPSNVANLTAMDGFVLFTAYDPAHGRELWRSDGTAAGTTMVVDIEVGGGGSLSYTNPTEGIPLRNDPGSFAVLKGSAYFQAAAIRYVQLPYWPYDVVPQEYTALWRSDGTAGGTRLITVDSSANHVDSFPVNLVATTDHVYFMNGRDRLMVTDGVTATTLHAGFWATYHHTAFGDDLVFYGTDYGYDYEPWVSDGTPAGTHRLADVAPGDASSQVSAFATVNGKVVFTALVDAGIEPYVSSGGTNDVSLLKDVNPGVYSSNAMWYTAVGDLLYFVADDGQGAFQIWKTDGTTAGTTKATNISPAGGVVGVGTSTLLGDPSAGILYFAAYDAASINLWRVGGEAGDQATKVTAATNNSTYPEINNLRLVDGKVFFTTGSTSSATKLWVYTPLTATMDAVSPSPRYAPVDSATVRFSEAASGVTKAAFVLKRDGVAVPIPAGASLASADGVTWTLSGLASATGTPGAYTLALKSNAGLVDGSGTPLLGGASVAFSILAPPALHVSQAVVNGGQADRSNVASLAVRFDADVDPATLTRSTVRVFDAQGREVPYTSLSYDAAQRTLSISLADSAGRTILGDGRYELRLDATAIHVPSIPQGRLIDDDGAADGVYRFGFFRLEGDFDGDATVGPKDQDLFLSGFGSKAGQSAYRIAYDLNGDGVINLADFQAFRRKLGLRI